MLVGRVRSGRRQGPGGMQLKLGLCRTAFFFFFFFWAEIFTFFESSRMNLGLITICKIGYQQYNMMVLLLHLTLALSYLQYHNHTPEIACLLACLFEV